MKKTKKNYKHCIICDKKYNKEEGHGLACSLDCYEVYYNSGLPQLAQLMG